MRRLMVFNQASLDGYIADESGDMSWAHKQDPEWMAFTSENASGEAELLHRAYRSCMRIVAELGLRSVAFPCISTGAYGYPVKEASRVAIHAIREFIGETGWHGEVLLVAFTALDHLALTAALEDAL